MTNSKNYPNNSRTPLVGLCKPSFAFSRGQRNGGINLNSKIPSFLLLEGDRTRNTQIDNLVLSPIELPGQKIWKGLHYSLVVLVLLVVFSPLCIASPEINLKAIAEIESSGRPNVRGDNGKALGLYQLHQCVITDYNRANKTKYVHKDALNPQISHLIASWYLNKELPRLLYYYKIKVSYKTILWAYNAGIGNVVKGRLPASTQNYLKKYERLTQ